MSDHRTIAPVNPAALEAQLRQLHHTATLLWKDAAREVWHAPLQNRDYELWFYPRGQRSVATRLGGGTAASDFSNLQLLQERKVPVVRPVAMLAGFRFGERIGDAILVEIGADARRLNGIVFPEPNTPDAARDHRKIVRSLTEILRRLGKERLGHDRLAPFSFIDISGEIKLCEPTGVTREGLTEAQLWQMAYAFAPAATTADRVRVFHSLTPEATLPRRDPLGAKRFKLARRADTIEHITIGEWQGLFRSASPWPLEWSTASRLRVDAAEWRREWPLLLQRIEAGQVEVLKSDNSGDVLASTIHLHGRPIEVVIKRPREKYVYRKIFAALRPARARRLWEKAVALQLRHLPIEYPLIVLQRRRFGYVTASVALFERVPGTTLVDADLDLLAPAERQRLFFDCGRILRRIEQTHLAHTDAKSNNWIVFNSPAGGATPVMVDAYGIRNLTYFLQLFGIRRLLRAMRSHPQYTPADSLAICQGFVPRLTPLEGDDD